MDIVIEHKRVKRKISGSGFNICGSTRDLETIKNAIEKKLAQGHVFGWLSIRDEVADEHCAGPNTAPLKWGN